MGKTVRNTNCDFVFDDGMVRLKPVLWNFQTLDQFSVYGRLHGRSKTPKFSPLQAKQCDLSKNLEKNYAAFVSSSNPLHIREAGNLPFCCMIIEIHLGL
jgi:hypothetical protein